MNIWAVKNNSSLVSYVDTDITLLRYDFPIQNTLAFGHQEWKIEPNSYLQNITFFFENIKYQHIISLVLTLFLTYRDWKYLGWFVHMPSLTACNMRKHMQIERMSHKFVNLKASDWYGTSIN